MFISPEVKTAFTKHGRKTELTQNANSLLAPTKDTSISFIDMVEKGFFFSPHDPIPSIPYSSMQPLQQRTKVPKHRLYDVHLDNFIRKDKCTRFVFTSAE